MPTPNAAKRRVNGFERPLDVHQVVSWVAFALLLAAFFGLHTPVRTARLFPGLAGAIESMRANSADSQSLRFHVVTLPAQVEAAVATLLCYGLPASARGEPAPAKDALAGQDTVPPGQIEVLPLPQSWLEGKLRVLADPSIT